MASVSLISGRDACDEFIIGVILTKYDSHNFYCPTKGDILSPALQPNPENKKGRSMTGLWHLRI